MVTDQFISTLLSATLDTQVQNGTLSFATLNPSRKRLHDEVGLEERLFSIPISVPTIRVVDSTMDVYAGPETCDGTRACFCPHF